MTPLGCAEGIVDFIKERLTSNDELTNSGEKKYKVYTGFLTIGMSRAEIKDLAPAIIVRPTEVTDGEKETVAVIGIYITDYDEDRVRGMAYFHGVRVSEIPTRIITPVQTTAGLPVVFGTAPVHLAEDPETYVNKPVICYEYKEAVAALGYSAEWSRRTF